MMPLSMVKPGETNTIKKVGGKEETRKFLENLGFVTSIPIYRFIKHIRQFIPVFKPFIC